MSFFKKTAYAVSMMPGLAFCSDDNLLHDIGLCIVMPLALILAIIFVLGCITLGIRILRGFFDI